MEDPKTLMRPDLVTAATVDQGILMGLRSGREFAAAYMARERVPLQVMARVLNVPTMRRRCALPFSK
ncbi:MAG: hypothetical protein V4724_26425 [Pseudomonadota bacterium]